MFWYGKAAYLRERVLKDFFLQLFQSNNINSAGLMDGLHFMFLVIFEVMHFNENFANLNLFCSTPKKQI